MNLRTPFRAGMFYPRDEAGCQRLIEECFADALHGGGEVEEPVAAILPHAGWVYSGKVAAGALQALAERTTPPELVVLFGAVHVPGVRRATLTAAEAWETPLGVVDVDPDAAAAVRDIVAVGDEAHAGEHSLEVEVPFLQRVFPDARILPIAVPPDESAGEVGRRVAEALDPWGDRVVFVGSTDLSHYGMRFGFLDYGTGARAHSRVKEERDGRMIRLMREMDVEAVVPEAHRNWNACGAGAIAATLGAARQRGKTRGVLTGHTTSAEVLGEAEPTDFVGYAGMVF